MTEKLDAALQRLTKWRTIFAGWQLGTRAKGDPECDAVRDHRELSILLRAELSAQTATLCRLVPGFSDAFREQLLVEAEQLSKDYEQRFPGVRATDWGIQMDSRAAETMKGWRP